jgi:hypothetical protein
MSTRRPLRNCVRGLGLSAVLVGTLASPAFALTLNVTDDTYVYSQRPNQILGATPVILIGNIGGRNQIGFVRFDLSPWPKSARSHKLSCASM